MTLEDGLAVIGVLFVLFATLVAAYFTTRLIGTRMLSVSRSGNTQKLSLVYRLPLGREQNLAVIQLGDRHLLVGCTMQSISLITELTEEESSLFGEGGKAEFQAPFEQFSKIFNQAKKDKEKQEE